MRLDNYKYLRLLTTLYSLVYFSVSSQAIAQTVVMLTPESQSQLPTEAQPVTRLFYENSGLRLFGITGADLSRERTELIQAINTYNEYLGPTKQLDVVLQEHPMQLLTMKKEIFREGYLAQLSYKGLTQQSELNGASNGIHKENILAHEACHKLLIQQVNQAGLQATTQADFAYGHPLIPDWFDESVAVLCENTQLNNAREQTAQQSWIPFSDFFEMPHPAFTQMQQQMSALISQAQSSKSGQSIGVFNIETDSDSNLSTQFYTQVHWFNRYLQQRLGKKVFAKIRARLAQQQDVSYWLLHQLNLKSFEALDTAFADYIQRES